MTTAATSPELPLQAAPTSDADTVTLSETDRSRLCTCIHTGHASARVRTRA
jgi:hypothetical protein